MSCSTSLSRSPLSVEWQQRFNNIKQFEEYATEPEQSLRDAIIKKQRIDELKLIEFRFFNTSWNDIRASKIEWRYMIIEDSEFTDVDFSQATITNATFKNTTFKNVTFDKAILVDVIFIDCEFEDVSFNQLKGPSQIEFIDSELRHPTFHQAKSDLKFLNCDIEEIELVEIVSGKLEFINGNVTPKYLHPRINVGRLIIDGVRLGEKAFTFKGRIKEAVVNNVVSDPLKGGVSVFNNNRALGMDRFTSQDCEMSFMTVGGFYVGEVDIKRFRGEELFLTKGNYGKVSIDSGEFQGIYLSQSNFESVTISNLKTRAFSAIKAKIRRMELDRVSFGNLGLSFTDLQVQRFLVRDVTFETKKHLYLEGSKLLSPAGF
jgi:uncharacterized protein YjbI with pentapeptide repeats